METGDKIENIEVIDKSLENVNAAQCHLSILAGKDGFSFCVVRRDLKKIILLCRQAYGPASSSLSEIVNRFPEPLGSHSVAYFSEQVHCIPDALARDEVQKKQLLNMSAGAANDLDLYPMAGYDFTLATAPSKELGQDPEKTFNHGSVVPLAAHVADFCLKESKFKPGATMVAISHPGFVEVCLARDGKLLLYNIFPATTHEDQAYFILNIAEQIEIEPAKTHLYTGAQGPDLLPTPFLKQYFANLTVMETFEGLSFSHEITRNLRQQFTALFLHTLCAL